MKYAILVMFVLTLMPACGSPMCPAVYSPSEIRLFVERSDGSRAENVRIKVVDGNGDTSEFECPNEDGFVCTINGEEYVAVLDVFEIASIEVEDLDTGERYSGPVDKTYEQYEVGRRECGNDRAEGDVTVVLEPATDA